MSKFHNFFVGILVFVLIASMATISNTIAIAESPIVDDATTFESAINNSTTSHSINEISTQTSIAAPTVIWDNTQYNMIVRYDWRVGILIF